MNEKEVPIFIKLEEYKDITGIIMVMKKKLHESKETLEKLKQLKTEEEKEIENWEQNLHEINKRMEFVEEILSQPRF